MVEITKLNQLPVKTSTGKIRAIKVAYAGRNKKTETRHDRPVNCSDPFARICVTRANIQNESRRREFHRLNSAERTSSQTH